MSLPNNEQHISSTAIVAEKDILTVKNLLQVNQDLYNQIKVLQKNNNQLKQSDLNHFKKQDSFSQLYTELPLNIDSLTPIATELQAHQFATEILHKILSQTGNNPTPLDTVSSIYSRIVEFIQRAIAQEKTIVRELEIRDGWWYQLMITPQLCADDHTKMCLMVTFNNISALKNLQSDLVKKNLHLTRVNEDLENFVYAASHDLLGPLGNIEMSIRGIQRHVEKEDFKLYLEGIYSSVKKFGELIKNMATIAKTESEKDNMEYVNLEEVIKDVTWSLTDRIDLCEATIVTDLEVNEIFLSPKNLQSIIYNLISNAIKFRGDNTPVIKIITRQEGDQTVLTVRDNGKGIPASGISKIFDIYGRLHQDIEGSGVGLFLARKIINAAGGKMMVNSEVGIGSDFILHFPIGLAQNVKSV